MTERWRKKLGDLDKQSPSDDVFERAKQGPMHAEDPLPRTKTSTRVVTAVAAFAVFALAISVFAIPALRMQGTSAGGQISGMFPLWPSQTPDQLQELQSQADAGTASWALDPQQVTVRFAQNVLAWPDARATADIDPYCWTMASSTQSPATEWIPGIPAACGTLPVGGYSAPGGPMLETPQATASSPGSGAFRSFSVIPCVRCQTDSPQIVQVYQPLGQGPDSIWAVFQAQSPSVRLSVVPGQTVRDGASISSGFLTYGRTVPTLGYSACGTQAASSAYNAPAGSDGAGIESQVQLPSSGGCEGPQPGYVWGALGTGTLANDNGTASPDPIAQGSTLRTWLAGITAVPAVMTFPNSADAVVAPTTTPDEPVGSPSTQTSWSSIDDEMGWTMSYPSSWTPAVFTEKSKVGQAAYSGNTGALTGVVVDVWTDPTAAATPPFTDDSTFPLDPNLAIDGGVFRANGLVFHVDISTDGTLTPEDDQIVHRIVSSITFKPWQVGDVRNDWAAIPTPTDDVSWITVRGGLYMLFRTAQRYRLYGAISCGGKDPSKTSARPDGFAVLECPDGSTWEMNADGASGGGGDASKNDPPPEWPVVNAFDGSLIAYVIPGEYPPGTGLSS